MNKKLRPIIKWTGGKYDEFASFSKYIPAFNRYIEPFFGGGGVFFALQPKVSSFINDKSTDLINFYKQIRSKVFKTELLNYANAWEEIGTWNENLWKAFGREFTSYIKGEIPRERFKITLTSQFSTSLPTTSLFTKPDFIINPTSFMHMVESSLLDKARRIKRISERENRVFNEEELKSHFETGIRSGAYLFFRYLLNQHFTKAIKLKAVKAAANWYFVREFCYGAMFRFNTKGEFNIPYGGIAYNRKNFRQKVENIADPAVTDLFRHSTIYNLDFEDFLNKIDLQSDDFIFLDPPYDSEFSEYDQSAFTPKDQERLANFLIKSKAKWMMVIKKTLLIEKLYTHQDIKIVNFNKNYTYNVRGRNNREVTHLIITNY